MSISDDIYKINENFNVGGTINKEAVNFLINVIGKTVEYFNVKLRESRQPVTPGSMISIIRKDDKTNPFQGDIRMYSISEGEKMILQVCIKNEDLGLQLEKLDVARYYNFNPTKNNCESGAFLAGVIQYIVEELIDMSSSIDKEISAETLKSIINKDKELSHFFRMVSP